MKDSSSPHPRTPSIRRSLVLSFARKYTTLLFTFPTVMVLSRLLTPREIGIYSVGAATVAIIQMLRDFGVSEYLVQEFDLTDAKVRSAFTINLCIAWALAAVVFATSPWIADFYREPGLRSVLQVLCLNFVLLPFGSNVYALLMRSMQFGIIYRISLGESIVRTSITLVLAWIGYGYMSLAWGSVAGLAANVLGCQIWGRAYQVKGLSFSHWRAVTRFGFQKTFGDIMNQVGLYAPDFVIGRILNFADVGLYSRGLGLINTFRNNIIGAIGSVAFPAFARSHRLAGDSHLLYLKALTFITGVAFPFMAFSALMAFPIIRIMFGPQWDAAVPILRLLAIAAFIAMLTSQFGEYLVAIGKVGLLTSVTIVIQSLRIAALALASFRGLEAAAASQVVVSIIAACIQCALLTRLAPITWSDLLRAVAPSLAVTGASIIVPVFVYVLMPPSTAGLWLPLVLSGLGGGIGWLTSTWMVKHPLWFEATTALDRVHHWRSARA